MEMPRRPLYHRQRTATPRPFSQTILPNIRGNARAAVASLANASSTWVGCNAVIPGSPVEDTSLAESVASLVPPFTLILILAFLILRIGFAVETSLSIDEAYAVLLTTAWAVVPILLGADPRLKLLRWSFAGLALGFALMSCATCLSEDHTPVDSLTPVSDRIATKTSGAAAAV
jgi:hypothetical protein